MVNENTLFKIVQTNDAALSACTDYGNESLIIDIDGGVYLGNNSSAPIKIADISQNNFLSGYISKQTSGTTTTYTCTGLDNFITPGESKFYIARIANRPSYGIPFIVSVVRVGNVSISQNLTPLFPTGGAGGDFYEISQGSVLTRNGGVSGFSGEKFYLLKLNAYNIDGLATVARTGNYTDLSGTPITLISNASITWNYQDPTNPTLTSTGLDNIVNNGVYIVENEIVDGNTTMNEDYLMRVLTYTSSGEAQTVQELTLCSIATELSYPQVNPNIKFLRYKSGSNAWSNWAPTTMPTSSSIYQCVYNTTTYNEAIEAYNDGKLLICNYNNRLYALNKISDDGLIFQITDGTIVYTLELNTNDIWSNSYFQVMAITSAYTKSETDALLADKANTATTISGYGITDAKIENGVITLGNTTITPLTAFTETDPVFESSVASNITSEDINNWNNKADTSDIPSDVSELTNDKNYIVANTALTNNRLVIGNNTQTDNGISTLNNPNGGDNQVLVANSASTPSWGYIGNLKVSANTDTLSEIISTGTTSANTLINQEQLIDTIRSVNAYYISSNDEMSQGYEYNTQYAGQPIYLEDGPWYKSTLDGIKQCTASTGVYVTVNDYAIVMHDETLLYFSADNFKYQRVKDGGVYGEFGSMRLPNGTLAPITTVTDGTRIGFKFTDNSTQTTTQHGGQSVDYVMWSLTITQNAGEQYIGGYTAGDTPDNTFDIYLPTARYICTVAQTESSYPVWSFQYIVSDVSLTSAQLAALNSGIDNVKVLNYDSHVTNTDIHVTTAQTLSWDAKQDEITTSGTPYGILNLSNNILSISDAPVKRVNGVDGSVTIGANHETHNVTGVLSMTLGDNNTLAGAYNTAIGSTNKLNAVADTVIGYNNTVNGEYSTTFGVDNIVGNSYSFAAGVGLLNGEADGTNNTAWQTVLGKYNVANGSCRFIIGNGNSDDARSNAFTVFDENGVGVAWAQSDVTCGGNMYSATHKLSEKISEAPTGGTMYVRQSAQWSPLPTQPPVVHLIGEIDNPNQLPVFAPLFFKVNGNHSTVLYELRPIITGTNTMTGCDISIRPLVAGDTVMFRNGEMWTHTNTFIIGGQTLEDLGYSVTPNPTSSAQTISAVTLTLGTPVTVDLYTNLSIQYKTWAGIFNGVTWNDEYKVQVTSYKLSDGLGGCYYCTSDGKYYVFDGYTWTPYDVVCVYNLFFYNMLVG